MKSAVRTTVVARVQTEPAKAPPSPTAALQLEFKRRVDARTGAAQPAAPATSIKEALSRWLDEQL